MEYAIGEYASSPYLDVEVDAIGGVVTEVVLGYVAGSVELVGDLPERVRVG